MAEIIKQYGLPRSGTNYARYLIEQNYKTRVIVDKEGWKHGYISNNLPPRRKCVLVCKNPFSWLSSIYQFHSKTDWSDIHIKKPKSMSEFLRVEFIGYHLGNLIAHKNPITCWNDMHRHWLAIKHTKRLVSILRHEDLINNAEESLRKLASELLLVKKGTTFIDTKNTFGRIGDGIVRPTNNLFPTLYYQNKTYMELFSQEDVTWINNQIDTEIVTKLNYGDYFRKPEIKTIGCKPSVYEPSKEEVKLDALIKTNKPKKVLVVFHHGLGDLLMFLEPFRALKESNPTTHFDLGLPKELGQKDVYPDAIDVGDDLDLLDYDLIAKIHFPMSEEQEQYTKGEWCCIKELGIKPTSGHVAPNLIIKNKLISVHFNITCLPNSCNPDEATAHKIWDEIIEAGYVPIESHFEHKFHNPINKKFDFVSATVRGCHPHISTLAGLLEHSAAFIGVVSGNFHLALSVLPPERIILLEKEFTAPMFTKSPIYRCDIVNYIDGSIFDWLKTTNP
jgi:hypothetical protein